MSGSYDVCVVGGGVVGLWTARLLAQAGQSVVLVEAQTCGAGASGGVLGALMAHAPDNWNIKKQFQFNALVDLPLRIQELEEEAGRTTGYRRCGRIMPIRREAFRAQAQRRAAQSRENWLVGDLQFGFATCDAPPQGNWLDPQTAPLGVVRDELAARVDPARYVAALKQSLAGVAEIREGWRFTHFDQSEGRAYGCDGGFLVANQIVLAAGYATFPMINDLIGCEIGAGVKGQAAVFACPEAGEHPLIYDDGVYIVPHDDGTCAVGSTSEKQWQDPSTPDLSRHDFIDRAKALCPPLRDAPLIKRWAGVRPRCNRTDPIIGRLQPESPVLVATGGYKITFGIAHRMAQCITEEVCGATERTSLPPTFRPEHHLRV